MTPLCRRGPLGLSPRTRGSPIYKPINRLGAGPIPADAGEPSAPCGRPIASWAYPRGRGGASTDGLAGAQWEGLSPRTRGSRLVELDLTAPVGPIPADAGEPRGRRCKGARPRAYPRGRGGAGRTVTGWWVDLGLSPRTRGSRWSARSTSSSLGPIPADAGEPWCLGRAPTALGAYPRGRGGASEDAIDELVRKGLSPRTRGSPPGDHRRILVLRPIPADAGEPAGLAAPSENFRAYPRGRGGAVEVTRASNALQGLSPRTRGSLPRTA